MKTKKFKKKNVEVVKSPTTINISSPDIESPITIHLSDSGLSKENTQKAVPESPKKEQRSGGFLSLGLKQPQGDLGDTIRLNEYLIGLTVEKIKDLDNLSLERAHILANKILTEESLSSINKILEKELEDRGLTIRKDIEENSVVQLGKSLPVINPPDKVFYSLNSVYKNWAEFILKEKKDIIVGPKTKGDDFSIHKNKENIVTVFVDGKNNTKDYPDIVKEIQKLTSMDFVISGKFYVDGEIIPIFKINDLLWLRGGSLEEYPWEERQLLLREILPKDKVHLKREDSIIVSDKESFDKFSDMFFCQEDSVGVLYKNLDSSVIFQSSDFAEFVPVQDITVRREKSFSFRSEDRGNDSILCLENAYLNKQNHSETFPFVLTRNISKIHNKDKKRKLYKEFDKIKELSKENQEKALKKLWKEFDLKILGPDNKLEKTSPKTVEDVDKTKVVVKGTVTEHLYLSTTPEYTKIRKCAERLPEIVEQDKTLLELAKSIHEDGYSYRTSNLIEKLIWKGNHLPIVKEIDRIVSWKTPVPGEVLQFPFEWKINGSKIEFLNKEKFLENQEVGKMLFQIKKAEPDITTSLPSVRQPFCYTDSGEVRHISSGSFVYGIQKETFHEYFFFPNTSEGIRKGRWVWQLVSGAWRAVNPEEQVPYAESHKDEVQKDGSNSLNRDYLKTLNFMNYENLYPSKLVKFSAIYQIAKVDKEQRLVYGPVLIPEEVDLQGDIVSIEEIRQAAWKYMEEYGTTSFQHTTFDTVEGIRNQVERALDRNYTVKQLLDGVVGDGMVPGIKNVLNRPMTFTDKITIRESFLAPVDFEVGGRNIKKGTWVMGMHVKDDLLWEQVKRGGITGFSIEGESHRIAA